MAPTGGFVVHRLVLAGSALQPGERGVCCLGLSFPASETVFHKCSASGKCRGPHGLCSSLRSWRSALRDPGGRSPGREAGVGGTGAGGPALASAPRQARSPALPSASLRLWPGRHRCFPATTDSACGAPGGGGWGGRPSDGPGAAEGPPSGQGSSRVPEPGPGRGCTDEIRLAGLKLSVPELRHRLRPPPCTLCLEPLTRPVTALQRALEREGILGLCEVLFGKYRNQVDKISCMEVS